MYTHTHTHIIYISRLLTYNSIFVNLRHLHSIHTDKGDKMETLIHRVICPNYSDVPDTEHYIVNPNSQLNNAIPYTTRIKEYLLP